MSAALQMPLTWAAVVDQSNWPEASSGYVRKTSAEQRIPDPAPGPAVSLAFYRRHTESLLRRYLYASMQVGRRIVRGDAVMVLSLDDPIPASLLATIHAINGIQESHPVTL